MELRSANVAITEKTGKVIVQNPIISAAGSVTSLADHRSPNTSQEPPPKLPSVSSKKAEPVPKSGLTEDVICDFSGKTAKVTVQTKNKFSIPSKTYGIKKSVKDFTKTDQLVSHDVSSLSTSGCFNVYSSPSKSSMLSEVTLECGSKQSKQPSLSLPIQTTSKSPFKITVIKRGNVEGAKQQLFGPSCTVNAGEDQSLVNGLCKETVTDRSRALATVNFNVTALSSVSEQHSSSLFPRVWHDRAKILKRKKRSEAEYASGLCDSPLSKMVNQDTIGCDDCDRWFHYSCGKIRKSDYPGHVPYVCPVCVSKTTVKK
ncbi:uncharacterized protein LOC116924386 [Daphnia magna]|nr:uncharacterized protein LOC116924386 [Daphnia magna]